MLREFFKIRLGILTLTAFAIVATSSVDAAEPASSEGFPRYDVKRQCAGQAGGRPAEVRQSCEDHEYAVAIMLRNQWRELIRREPVLTAGCEVSTASGASAPSYVSLLQCLARTSASD